MKNSIRTTEYKRENLYCEEKDLYSSGLLSPSRCANLEAQINACITPVYDGSGKVIPDCALAEEGKQRMLYPRIQEEHMKNFMRRNILKTLLTDEEVELIDGELVRARHERYEKALRETAKAVTSAECTDGVFYGDTWYESVEEAIEAISEDYADFGDDDEEYAPIYLWAAKKEKVIHSVSVSDIFQDQIEQNGWEDMDDQALEGKNTLQEAINEFAKENENVVAYHIDYSRYVEAKYLTK